MARARSLTGEHTWTVSLPQVFSSNAGNRPSQTAGHYPFHYPFQGQQRPFLAAFPRILETGPPVAVQYGCRRKCLQIFLLRLRECMGIEPTASFVQTRHWF